MGGRATPPPPRGRHAAQPCEDVGERRQIRGRGRLVERQHDMVGIDAADVEAGVERGGDGLVGPTGHLDVQRIEVLAVQLAEAGMRDGTVERLRHGPDAGGDGTETRRSVVDGVHRGHVRQQRLRRADV
jgi:hypothetical protein